MLNMRHCTKNSYILSPRLCYKNWMECDKDRPWIQHSLPPTWNTLWCVSGSCITTISHSQWLLVTYSLLPFPPFFSTVSIKIMWNLFFVLAKLNAKYLHVNVLSTHVFVFIHTNVLCKEWLNQQMMVMNECMLQSFESGPMPMSFKVSAGNKTSAKYKVNICLLLKNITYT